MKVLFISHHLYCSGSPITLFRLVRELKKQNKVEISVLSYLDGPLRKWYEGIGISPVIKNLYDANPQNIKKLTEIIKIEKADLILSNTLNSINGCFAAHLCKKPGILYVHQDWPQVNLSTLHLFAFKLSDLIVFASKYQKSVYQPLLEGVPVKILRNGIPFDVFDPHTISTTKEEIKKMNNLPENKKIVSIIGNVCNRKRQDLFVYAAQEILKKRKDVLFLIIGRIHEKDTYHQLLKKYIQAGRLESDILFLGAKEDIKKYYHISDAIVCCSVNDVAPVVLLEAQASKKPVIATSIDGIPEIVKHGVNGVLIKPNNQKQLEDAILKVLDNYEDFSGNIEKDYEDFRIKYNIQNIAKSFQNLIGKTKPQKKKYKLVLSRSEIKFIFKKDTILRFKEIIPFVSRKASSAFR